MMFDNIPVNEKSAFYIFDTDTLIKRVEFLKKSLPDNVALCYAVKANPFIAGELADKAERFEVCSSGECEICDNCGIPFDKTVISGVYKTPSVMERLIAETEGRIYTSESISQFKLFVGLSRKYNKKLKMLLRLTNDSQFGMNAEEIEEIIKNRSDCENIDFIGIQFFSGTQKTSLKKLKRELEMLEGLLLTLDEKYGYNAEELEYGAGFPVSYFADDEFDEREFLKGFCEILNSTVSKRKIVIELGRSIAACCGKYYTHIVDIKSNKGQNYLITDGGMNHIVYYGQHMAMRRPTVSVAGRENNDPVCRWNICGALCSMNDIIAKQIPLPPVETGDILCFENAGAYCMTEGISLFLSREIPAVYIRNTNGSLDCVRRSFETAALNTPKRERNM